VGHISAPVHSSLTSEMSWVCAQSTTQWPQPHLCSKDPAGLDFQWATVTDTITSLPHHGPGGCFDPPPATLQHAAGWLCGSILTAGNAPARFQSTTHSERCADFECQRAKCQCCWQGTFAGASTITLQGSPADKYEHASASNCFNFVGHTKG
jgi:hypothetical protein